MGLLLFNEPGPKPYWRALELKRFFLLVNRLAICKAIADHAF